MIVEANYIYETIELEPILHNCKRIIDRKCKDGIIPAKKVGRVWLVEGSNLLAYLKDTKEGRRRK